VPEYCGRLDEEQVTDKAFELIFAFDEVIAVGYKEKVTLQQIKTFLEMDSQEEKIHEMLEKVRCRSFLHLASSGCRHHCHFVLTFCWSVSLSPSEQRARGQGGGGAQEAADREHEEARQHGRHGRYGQQRRTVARQRRWLELRVSADSW
jgi:hypothetical protein